ncbi:MAG: NTP transferase domain-containing protein [Rhodospirillales bacterium]|nr:NTP transferase domain-containing protein [Rhodospirillales bacterium]
MGRPAALILAGGKALRLGGVEKPLLGIGGRTLLARILAALGESVAAVAISANGDPARFSRFGLPVLADGPFEGEGPLAGVLAGLDWAGGIGVESLLSVPGDTPFLPAGLAAALAPPPAVAASGGRRHHLAALWPLSARDALRRRLTAPGPRAVAAFADAIGVRVVPFACAPWDPFLNINTPADLAEAEAIAERVPA